MSCMAGFLRHSAAFSITQSVTGAIISACTFPSVCEAATMLATREAASRRGVGEASEA